MAKDEKKEEKKTDAKAELPPDEAAAKSRKKRLLIMVGGGVLLAGGIGGGAAFFLSSGKDKMAAKSPADELGATPEAAAHGKPKKDEKGAEAKGGEHAEVKKDEKGADGKKDVKSAEAKKDVKDGKDDKGKKDDLKLAKLEGVDFGCTQTLTPFHLNLGNPLENRYIRLEVALEYACAEETKAEVDKRLPQLRDAVISVTSRKTREFLLGPDGKEQLRKEIHNRLNHYMTRKIEDVYITDILIE